MGLWWGSEATALTNPAVSFRGARLDPGAWPSSSEMGGALDMDPCPLPTWAKHHSSLQSPPSHSCCVPKGALMDPEPTSWRVHTFACCEASPARAGGGGVLGGEGPRPLPPAPPCSSEAGRQRCSVPDSSLCSPSSCFPHCHVNLDSCHASSETHPVALTQFWKDPWTRARKPSLESSLCFHQSGDLGRLCPGE